MRCDQHIGLPTEAIFFLDKMEVEPNVCHDCERPYPRDLEVIDNYYGMFNNQYNLYRHQLKDGRYADEFLQADPWSSGPCFFIGLRVYDLDGNVTEEFKWNDEELANA